MPPNTAFPDLIFRAATIFGMLLDFLTKKAASENSSKIELLILQALF
jgi:hypothetical protein